MSSEQVYDIQGRKARMAKLISMDAPRSIILEEAWLLLYGYAGGPWRGVWWCLKNVVLDKLESVRFKLFGLPDDDLEFDEDIGKLQEEMGLEMELGVWDGVCVWRETDNPAGNVWETSCGQAHIFFGEGPEENECRFCCYCGKPLKAGKLLEQAIELGASDEAC